MNREQEDENVNRLLGDELPAMEKIVARKANRVFLLDPAEALVFYMEGGIVRVRVDNDRTRFPASDTKVTLLS